MTRIHRILLSLIPLLMACAVLGMTDAELAQRVLEETGAYELPDSSGSGKGKGGSGGKGKGGSVGKGKGKGKGPDGDFDLSMSLPMSLSMSMPGPKGPKGKDKGSKSAKKSSKKGPDPKGSKKGSKKGGEPNAPSPGQPVGPPGPPSPITAAPTSANSIPVRATPYALMYNGDFTRIPTDQEFASVAEVTRAFLEEIVSAEFSQTSLTILDDFVTFMIRNSFNFGEPVQGDYRSTALFNPSSIFLPTVREINSLITSAFTDSNLEDYVSRVQALPSDNIFSTTTAVMKGLPDVPIPREAPTESSSQSSSTMKMGLAAAASGIVVLAAGAALMRRQRSDQGLEDPYSDNLKGDSATVADETYSPSIDSSTAWRKSSPYVTNADDDGEFEDEPLSDDEKEKSTGKTRRLKGVPPKAAFTS